MIFHVRNIVVLLVLLGVRVHSGNGQVPRDQLFPFGPTNGDTTVVTDARDLHHSDPIILLSPFTFFNMTHSELSVSHLGNILFNKGAYYSLPRKCDSNERSSRGPRIAPFWSVVSLDHGGQASYRETTNPDVITEVRDEIMKGFPDVGDLAFKSVFIATWDNVAHDRDYECPDDNLRNTFQAILASDGKKSFVILYYKELTWTLYTRAVQSRCVPADKYPAAAGFTAGQGHPFHDVLRNCTADVLKLTEKSNVDEPGKWVFRVDQEIQSPTFRGHKTIIPSYSSKRNPFSIGSYSYTIFLIICIYH